MHWPVKGLEVGTELEETRRRPRDHTFRVAPPEGGNDAHPTRPAPIFLGCIVAASVGPSDGPPDNTVKGKRLSVCSLLLIELMVCMQQLMQSVDLWSLGF